MDQIVFSPNSQDLSALVASRLCHDLGNPFGAVSNGVEISLSLSDTRVQISLQGSRL